MGGDPYGITGRIHGGDNRDIMDIRFRGIGRRMVEELEAFARDRLNARQLTLVVRSYNSPAQGCYLNFGFKPYAQEGTLIRMAKEIGAWS